MECRVRRSLCRQSLDLACILFDVDHFKAINDKYGHLKGDEVLRQLAQRVNDSIRSYDIFGRYGGEEFLLALPSTGTEDLKTVAERTRTLVAEAPLAGISLTISLGISCRMESDTSIDSLISRADQGLYRAKDEGRNRVGSVIE